MTGTTAHTPTSGPSSSVETPADLTLLVAGESAATRAARANLGALIGDGVATAERVRVIDVLEQPTYALRYRAFFTPTLIVETTAGTTSIVGDLAELDEIRHLLTSLAA